MLEAAELDMNLIHSRHRSAQNGSSSVLKWVKSKSLRTILPIIAMQNIQIDAAQSNMNVFTQQILLLFFQKINHNNECGRPKCWHYAHYTTQANLAG